MSTKEKRMWDSMAPEEQQEFWNGMSQSEQIAFAQDMKTSVAGDFVSPTSTGYSARTMKKWCLVHWQWCLQFIVQVGILVFLIKGVSVSRLPMVYVESLPMVQVDTLPSVYLDLPQGKVMVAPLEVRIVR